MLSAQKNKLILLKCCDGCVHRDSLCDVPPCEQAIVMTCAALPALWPHVQGAMAWQVTAVSQLLPSIVETLWHGAPGVQEIQAQLQHAMGKVYREFFLSLVLRLL